MPLTNNVPLADTSKPARRRQLEIYAHMDGADKIRQAVEMAEQSKSLAVDGIRSRNPELSQAQVHQTWLRMLHGDRAGLFPNSAPPLDS